MNISPISYKAYNSSIVKTPSFKAKRSEEENRAAQEQLSRQLINAEIAIKEREKEARRYYYDKKYDIKNFVTNEENKIDGDKLRECARVIGDLDRCVKLEIPDEIARKLHNEIVQMKYEILKECSDATKTEIDGYDSIYGNYMRYKNYVESASLNLSYSMNVPPRFFKSDENLTISEYINKHPNSINSYLFDSSLYKILTMLKLNRPNRTHFHE